MKGRGKKPHHGLALLLLGVLVTACATPAPIAGPANRATGPTGIQGRVLSADGQPVEGAVVYTYRNPAGGLRGPADFAAEVGSDGRYFLDLAAGRYWLVARYRPDGSQAGPPRPGDSWAIYSGNPAMIEEGDVRRADFLLLQGRRPALGRSGNLSSGDTGFTGRVTDAAGRPLAGLVVLAYRRPEFHGMPDFISAASDRNGRFVLYVPAGGRYCLAARAGTRGQPVAGELYGRLGVDEAACRSVAAGELADVGALVVSPFGP